MDFRVALPSWALAAGGTRFGRFPVAGEPRTIIEKMEDCAAINALVRVTPAVSIHIPWDRPECPAELKAFAKARGLRIDSTNSNTFQDHPGQRHSYRFGSLTHTDAAVRRQAIDHNIECLALGAELGAEAHTVWIGDGANYPGQVHARRALDRYLDSLTDIYSALPDNCRLFLEHKLYEPAFYATVISDWGTSYVCAQALGDRAFSLVDLGHHAPNVNIEQIVARLIQLGKLGGLHFNDSKYGDDDLDAGSIKPFQLFLVFNELVDASNDPSVPAFRPAYMLDQSHAVTDPAESLMMSATELVRACVQAHLVDREALAQLPGAKRCADGAAGLEGGLYLRRLADPRDGAQPRGRGHRPGGRVPRVGISGSQGERTSRTDTADRTRPVRRGMNQEERMRPGFFLNLLLLCFLTATAVEAQEARGTITGTVVDSSKAVIAGATVTVTNVAMNTSVTVVTNSEGFFQAPYLIPGAYRITVELAGFKKLVREGIQVSVADRLQLELPLEIGGADRGGHRDVRNRPCSRPTNGSLGQVVDARRVAELPIPHGDPYALIGLAAGVSFMRSSRLDRPFEPTHIVGYAMNGVRSNRSDVTIDGLPSTSTANAGEITASFVPPQGLVQEFKVQTATFDASLGNTEGGVTNLVLKSGTNKLAGEVYFVKTPKGLWANDYFANANGIPLSDFRYTRWSGVAGGPVLLPGIYNGRGKTFFIYGYEALPEARPRNNGTPTVPSEKMRNGDFSELLAIGPAVPDLQPVHAPRDRRRPLPAGSVPGQHHSPQADEPRRTAGARVHRQAEDAGKRRRNAELPAARNEGRDRLRVAHRARRPRADVVAAALRTGELVRSEQQLQQLLRQHLHGPVVPFRVAPVRRRSRLDGQPDHGDERTVRLRSLPSRRPGQSRELRHGPDDPGLPRAITTTSFRRTSASSRASTSPAIRELASRVRTVSPRTRRRSARSPRRWARTRSGPAPNGGSTARRACCRPTTRPVNSISGRPGHAGRSITPRPRPTRSDNRSPRSCSGCPRPAAS